jgi:hypothetical protein
MKLVFLRGFRGKQKIIAKRLFLTAYFKQCPTRNAAKSAKNNTESLPLNKLAFVL